MAIRIGINGVGRIGRTLLRVLRDRQEIEVVAVNDVMDIETAVHLLKYDSIHRAFPGTVSADGENLRINDQLIRYYRQEHPAGIPWDEAGADIVVECSGRFKDSKSLEGHLKKGVKKVILSVPPVDDMKMIVLGVNDDLLDGSERFVSNASCTTNCAAPMIKVVNDLCDVEYAYVTTVHSYTTDQQVHDTPHKDLRRARAAALSIVPTTTGAAKAMTRIFPAIQDKIGGCGIRVPVPDGSLTDITFTVNKHTSADEVNKAFKSASEGNLKGIIGYTSDPIVSSDIIGSPYSVLFDEQLTSVIGNMVKVVGWYDNEMGYSNRLADLIIKVA